MLILARILALRSRLRLNSRSAISRAVLGKHEHRLFAQNVGQRQAVAEATLVIRVDCNWDRQRGRRVRAVPGRESQRFDQIRTWANSSRGSDEI